MEQELRTAVGDKDALLALVGRELLAPLRAICHLAPALASGAGECALCVWDCGERPARGAPLRIRD